GYQLVKRIGSGGMGEVYRAVQVALGRQVAIKILSPELTEDRTFVDRFMTEARAAGKLNHPNVAQVHEVGENDGIYYYSMEYLPGGSVQEKLRGGRKMPLPESVKVALSAARALDYAEKHGVIHCDIKPDNLMLDEDGEVRLTDLGIARTVKSMAEKVKQEGGVLGSPHYMAPEQARGEPIDHRVDIYALGATFYRIIAGRTPFTGKNAREIMEKQVYEEPPGLRSLDPAIPQSVCRVITRMMKKKPEKRYQTARELILDLERLQEELAPPQEDETVSRRQSRSMRRARRAKSSRVFVVLAVVVAAIAAALLYLAVSSGGGTAKRDIEQMMSRARAHEDNNELEAALDIYRNVLRLVDQDSEEAKAATGKIEDLKEKIATARARAQLDDDWQALEGMKKRAKTPADFKRLAEAYRKFATKHPYSSKTGTARLAATQAMARYEAAAAAKAAEIEKDSAELIATCKFVELSQRWRHLADSYSDTPAGKDAAAKAEAALAEGPKQLEAAKAQARKVLADGKFDEVLKPLERFKEADNAELRKMANTAIEEMKKMVDEAKAKQAAEADRKRRMAACKAIRDKAVELALGYEYAESSTKFVEAQLAYRRQGFDKEAAGTKKMAEAYRSERKLFDKLYDYGREGGLRSAFVSLADGRKGQVVSALPDGVTYKRGVEGQEKAAWTKLPVATVYDLLRRPKHTFEEELALVHFALHRDLKKQAKAVVLRLMSANPKRKEELAPLLKAAEGGTPKKD
ncbi:MAG: serine/threonine-protein kinase, partial [Planctomycetota bacterium]